jgi:uncharacterized protein
MLLGEDGRPVEQVAADVTADEVDAAADEFLALQRQGRFLHVNPRFVPPHPFRRYDIHPTISRRCNLRCRYCFVDHEAMPDMSMPVMEETARFMARHYASFACHDAVSFGLAGEASAQLPQYDQFAALLAEVGRQHGVDLSAHILFSNFTMLGDLSAMGRVSELKGAQVSLDGPEPAHDANRVRPDGSGTYEDAMSGVRLIRRLGGSPSASATVTAMYPDVSGIYFHLLEQGFTQLMLKPVRARPDQPHAIQHQLRAICSGYDRFVDRLLDLPDQQLLASLLSIYGTRWGTYDYFGRFLVRVIEGHVVERRCPAWIEDVHVAADGRLYGCQSLLGVPEAQIGTIWGGADERRVAELAERFHISHRVPCKNCWARLICGGGCMHQSYLTYGEFDRPDPAECSLNQHLIELAAWTCQELRQTREAVFAALPRILRDSWQSTSPTACGYLPPTSGPQEHLHDLVESRPCATLRPQQHLKLRLLGPGDDDEVEIRLAWDLGGLRVLLTHREDGTGYLQSKLRTIRVYVRIPRGIAGSYAQRLPPLMSEATWTLSADISAGRVSYEEAPWQAMIGDFLPGSLLISGAAGCLISVPWAAIGVAEAMAGMAFGLQIVLHDVDGGELQWHPNHVAGSIILQSG